MKLLKAGDRVKMKVRTIFGWKGTGSLVYDETPDRILLIKKDGDGIFTTHARRSEVTLVRKTKHEKAAK